MPTRSHVIAHMVRHGFSVSRDQGQLVGFCIAKQFGVECAVGRAAFVADENELNGSFPVPKRLGQAAANMLVPEEANRTHMATLPFFSAFKRSRRCTTSGRSACSCCRFSASHSASWRAMYSSTLERFR